MSAGTIFKHGWIVLQSCMMTYFMIRGAIAYSGVIKGWSKLKSLFCFFLFLIVYLIVNEFTHMNFHGIFIILLLAQYSYFLTFSLVIDSCITIKDDETLW